MAVDVSKILLSHAIRPSRPRRAIYEYLYTHRTHPTAEDVYCALCNDIRTLSRTTVYNTLRLFCDKGAAQMVTVEEKEMRFDAEVAPHGHFKCTGCGAVFDFPCDFPQEGLDKALPGVVAKQLRFYVCGLCAKCAQTEK